MANATSPAAHPASPAGLARAFAARASAACRGLMRPGNVDLDGFTIWAHVHGLTSLIISGRVECMRENVEAMPEMPMEQLVDLSLQSLLKGFR